MKMSDAKTIFTLALTLFSVMLGSYRSEAQPRALGTRNTLNLWDAADGTLIHSTEIEDYIWRAALNEDGTVVAAVHDDGILSTYDTQSGAVLHRRRFTGNTRFTMIRRGFAPEQVFVIQNEHFWLWDYVADSILVEGGTGVRLDDILPGPDGKRFVVINQMWQVLVFDAMSGEVLVSIGPLPRIWDVQWSPDGRRIAVAHREGFDVFDSVTGANLLAVRDERFSDVYSKVSWSPDGATLLALAGPSLNPETTELFVMDGWTLARRLSIHADKVIYSLAWSADHRRVVTASYKMDGVAVYDVYSGQLVHSYGDDPAVAGFLGAGWNPDNSLIAGGGVMKSRSGIRYVIWDAATGKPVQERTAYDSLLFAVWNARKTRVLFWVWPSSVADVIDLMQPDAPRYTLTHQDTMQGAVWSADGSRILTWTGRDMG